jgi:hypothetical protein
VIPEIRKRAGARRIKDTDLSPLKGPERLQYCAVPNEVSVQSRTSSSLVHEVRGDTLVQGSTVQRQISKVSAEATRRPVDSGSSRRLWPANC